MAKSTYKPMLAKVLGDNPTFDLSTALIQPKLDGKCILAHKVDGEVALFARSGNSNDTTPHINRQLNSLMQDGDIWHGELYSPDLTLEEIMEVTQATQNPKDSSGLNLYLYDFPKISGLTEYVPYQNRLRTFKKLHSEDTLPANILLTPTISVDSVRQIEEYHRDVTEQGFEGVIIRNPVAPYKAGRSNNLLKMKTWRDAEFLVIAVNEGKGKLQDHAGSFTCVTSDMKHFNVKMEGELVALRDYLNHPELAIGRYLTVKYYGLTKYGIPRHPIGVRFRE